MNKEEFLQALEKELSILNDKEREDIIDEYKDTIEEKVKHGQSEEDAVRDFGKIDELVSEILDAYKINPEYNQKDSSFDKIAQKGESLIKKGAGKLADMTRDFVNNIKDNDTEMNLNLAFEIIIKIFFTLIILAILTVPFRIFKDLGFSFADTFFSPLSGLFKIIILLLFIALYFGVALIIIISLFKQYFKKAKMNQDEKEVVKEDVQKTKEELKEEKPVKIIHRNGPTVGSVLLLIVKIWVALIVLLPLFFIDVCVILGLFISIFYWIKGINLFGLTLLLLGISSLFIWFTILVYNLTFSKGKTSIIPFFIGTAVTVFGALFFIDMVSNIEYIDEAPKSFKTSVISKEFTTDKDIYIDYYLNGDINKQVDETMPDNTFKINLTYDKNSTDVNIYNESNYNFPQSYCENNVSEDCFKTYNYISLNYDYIDGYKSAKERYNDFIDNLKHNKIYNYSKSNEVNVEVVANSKTLNIIEIG